MNITLNKKNYMSYILNTIFIFCKKNQKIEIIVKRIFFIKKNKRTKSPIFEAGLYNFIIFLSFDHSNIFFS